MRSTFVSIFALFAASCGVQTPDEAPLEQLDQSIIDRIPIMMDAYDVDGLAVVAVSGEQTLLAEGYGVTLEGTAFKPDTSCPVYSATKVFTSLTFASLVEAGAFDVNSTLSEYLTDAPEEWASIPFWRLLNHTSGIPMIVNKPIFQEFASDPKVGNPDIYQFVRSLPLDYAPGEFSRYRQSGYGIAEMILSEQTGQSWPELVAEHLNLPANATRTVHADMENVSRDTPMLASAGGYQTTSNDMALIFKSLNRGEIVSPEFLEAWLYDEIYDFDSYSLGSVLIEVDDVQTIGHSGGGRANIRFAPSKSVGIMICTDDRSNNNIAIDLANMLMREIATDGPSLMPIQTELLTRLDEDAEEFIAFYETEKSRSPRNFEFSNIEGTLNQIGYQFLGNGRTEDAIGIFRLNTTEYPSSPNTYDSLGEALFTAERYEEALQNYRKVLELRPGDDNAVKMIEKINASQVE